MTIAPAPLPLPLSPDLAPWRFRQISLYAAYLPETEVAPLPLPGDDLILTQPLSLSFWLGRRFAYTPPVGHPWVVANDLPAVFAALFTSAQRQLGADPAVFFVLHVGHIQRTASPQQAGVAPHRGGTPELIMTRPALPPIALGQLQQLIHAVYAAHLLRGGVPELSRRYQAFFSHYSPQGQRRGQVVLDPRLTLAIGVSQADARLVLEYAQQARLGSAGIEPVDYATLLTRISAWNANADTQALFDGFTALNRANALATRRQILLNIGIACIGALMAIALSSTGLVAPQTLITPLVLFTVAAILHIISTLNDARWVEFAADLLLGGAIVYTILLLLWPHVIAWRVFGS